MVNCTRPYTFSEWKDVSLQDKSKLGRYQSKFSLELNLCFAHVKVSIDMAFPLHMFTDNTSQFVFIVQFISAFRDLKERLAVIGVALRKRERRRRRAKFH